MNSNAPISRAVLVQLACGEAEHGPGVLLLDEPTSSLDLRYQINLVEIAASVVRVKEQP